MSFVPIATIILPPSLAECREIRIRRIEPRRKLGAPSGELAALNIVQRIRVQVLHQKCGASISEEKLTMGTFAPTPS
jgi:hypothetical protein